jgi:hypothetical protein
MNEIVIRRSFLDRRSCVESTHQLKFEEDQENQLMSSIIPQHIIVKVRLALMEYIRRYEKNNNTPQVKPFEYVCPLVFCSCYILSLQRSLRGGSSQCNDSVCRHCQLHRDDNPVERDRSLGHLKRIVWTFR